MTRHTGNSIAWTLVVVLAVAVACLLWQRGPSEPCQDNNCAGTVLPGASEEVTQLAETARRLHQAGDWCSAQTAWAKLLAKTADQDRYLDVHYEAEQNLRMAQSNCQPSQPPVDHLKISELPPARRPTAVPEPKLAEFYKVGKVVRSVGMMNMTGSGRNWFWAVFKGATNFAYQYRVAAETKVVENNGTRVVFEQYFPEVTQLLARSQQEIEIVPVDSPVLSVVWGRVDAALSLVPVYQLVKQSAEIGQIIDPGLKRTVTSFNNMLRHRGIAIAPDESVTLVAQVEKLAGLRVRITYVSGQGATAIEVLDGKKFDPDQLQHLAANSSVLMDFFLSEGAKRKVGEPFEVRVEDVRGVCSVNYDLESTGALQLKKQSEVTRDGETLTVLEVVGGEISLRGTVDGIEQSGQILPIPGGFIRFSEKKGVVRLAKMDWQANRSFNSKNHLLFGTENVTNLRLETYYEADLSK